MDGFFSLSAFVIGGILIRSTSAARTTTFIDFLHRRAARVMPGYFLTVIVGLAVAAFIDQLAISHHHYNLPYDLSNAWQYFFFVQRVSLYWNDNYQHLDILNHTWSLAVEEQFYLVCGFLWIALRSSYARWGVTAVCVCLGIAARTSDVNAGLALYHLGIL
jgi:peptidoglycan/LPS O-acetylase OafA/YrhL